jgi:hypothetical protein
MLYRFLSGNGADGGDCQHLQVAEQVRYRPEVDKIFRVEKFSGKSGKGPSSLKPPDTLRPDKAAPRIAR